MGFLFERDGCAGVFMLVFGLGRVFRIERALVYLPSISSVSGPTSHILA